MNNTGKATRKEEGKQQMLVTGKNVRKRYDNSDLQELYEFKKRKSGERALGLYVLKGTRTALRGKRETNPSTLPG